jgi:hypothetical protein
VRREEHFLIVGRNNPHKPQLPSSLSPKKANPYKNLKASGVLLMVMPLQVSVERAMQRDDGQWGRNGEE